MREQGEIEAQALAVLNVDGKIEAVRELAGVQQRLTAARAEVEQLERRYGAAHVAAVRVGWAEQELGKLGFEEPTRRPQGRPRGKGRPAGKAARSEPAPVSEPPATAAGPEAGVHVPESPGRLPTAGQ